MADTLEPSYGHERKFGNDSAVEAVMGRRSSRLFNMEDPPSTHPRSWEQKDGSDRVGSVDKCNTYMLLKHESNAVKATPIANIDFILTKLRSLLLLLSLSSSRSRRFLDALSFSVTLTVSFFFSTAR